MSRLSRDEAASGLAVRAVEQDPPRGPALVLEDPLMDVAHALRACGVPVSSWSRFGGDVVWPPADATAELVALRLPRARRELDMLLHVAASALAPGGRLLVYGANDEGIKSVTGKLGALFEGPVTLATGGHARLIRAIRASDGPAPRGGVMDWVSTMEIDLLGRVRPWVSYPGVFAEGRIDEGTALLLEHLPEIADGARVLDYGAGTGVLAAGVLERCPTAQVTALEPDGLAAAAAVENVPMAEVRLGRGWAALPANEQWEVIVSNPPYHRGKAETLAEIESFLGGVATALAPAGVMRCVVQRRLPFDDLARRVGLDRPRVVVDRGPYRVWEVGGSSRGG